MDPIQRSFESLEAIEIMQELQGLREWKARAVKSMTSFSSKTARLQRQIERRDQGIKRLRQQLRDATLEAERARGMMAAWPEPLRESPSTVPSFIESLQSRLHSTQRALELEQDNVQLAQRGSLLLKEGWSQHQNSLGMLIHEFGNDERTASNGRGADDGGNSSGDDEEPRGTHRLRANGGRATWIETMRSRAAAAGETVMPDDIVSLVNSGEETLVAIATTLKTNHRRAQQCLAAALRSKDAHEGAELKLAELGERLDVVIQEGERDRLVSNIEQEALRDEVRSYMGQLEDVTLRKEALLQENNELKGAIKLQVVHTERCIREMQENVRRKLGYLPSLPALWCCDMSVLKAIMFEQLQTGEWGGDTTAAAKYLFDKDLHTHEAPPMIRKSAKY